MRLIRNAATAFFFVSLSVLALPAQAEPVTLVALGDSLTAGYGLPEGEGLVPQLQAWLDAQGAEVTLINAGVSGDTTAGGLSRLDWSITPETDAMIVTLGGNDLLRGLSPEETKANLGKMLAVLREAKVPVLLMGMRAPPNYGPEYQAEFDALYRDLAKEYDAALIPFWLEDIYRDPALFQSDRIHPTAEGIERLVSSTLGEVEGALPAPEGS